MVDISNKNSTERVAVAGCEIHMQQSTFELIKSGQFDKGDVLGVARVAGVMAAKKTSELIPLCHPIALNQVTVEFGELPDATGFTVITTARMNGKTGVEMEALTAVSVAALTVYDMCKSVDRGVRIEAIRLVSKRGGQNGDITLEE